MAFRNRARAQSGPGRRSAFTLIELLVVIFIVIVLIAMMIPAVIKALLSAERIKCANNLSQLGKAMKLYQNENRQKFPPTVATANPPVPANGWVAVLKPYFESNNRILMCPADPQAADRVANGSSSYVFNNFLTKEVPASAGGALFVADVTAPSKVITFFPIADGRGTGPYEDHVHAENWFSSPGGAWFRLLNDITPDRFGGKPLGDRMIGVSNYVFVDGHTEVISASGLRERCDLNDSTFARPK